MIRPAAPRDYPAIRAVIRHAFGRADEADLVERLREDGEVAAEFVHGDEHVITGHILYSRLPIEREQKTLQAAALAPLAVAPAFQKQGQGGALIEAGNARCRDLGLAAIVVLGHPHYYPRFGFSARAAAALDAPFSGESFMALELAPGALQAGGRVRYARAFGVN